MDSRRQPLTDLIGCPITIAIGDHTGHIGFMNHELQLRDAKATLSAVIDQALHGEPPSSRGTAVGRLSC